MHFACLNLQPAYSPKSSALGVPMGRQWSISTLLDLRVRGLTREPDNLFLLYPHFQICGYAALRESPDTLFYLLPHFQSHGLGRPRPCFGRWSGSFRLAWR